VGKLKDLLRGVLSKEELEKVPSSFDIVGSREGAVAIIEIPPELYERRRLIAEAIMRLHKNVRTVVAKRSPRKGAYRVRDYEIILGSENTEVTHKEYGALLKLDPLKVYFSPREATERLRVASKVRPGEVVMLMFAGVGPYAVAIARVQPLVRKIIAIEINPDAYRYLIENVRLNKLEGKVIPVLGDVRDKCRHWYGRCDRVVMPLPKGAYEYLDEAFRCLKPQGGVIHFYHWGPEGDLFGEGVRIINEYAQKYGVTVKILEKRKVLPYAPKVYKVCIEFEVRPKRLPSDLSSLTLLLASSSPPPPLWLAL